jgi:hypothetical protein
MTGKTVSAGTATISGRAFPLRGRRAKIARQSCAAAWVSFMIVLGRTDL